MYRTLTAAVALAAALGTAGLAQAQTNSTAGAAGSPTMTSPSASQPGMSGTQHPATMAPGQSQTGTYGQSGAASERSPQANAQTQGGQQASQEQIQQAQEQLKSQGLYHGAVDGIMGPETQTAVMAFQRKQGLPQTAQLDEQTMSRLGGSGASGESNTGAQPMTSAPSVGTQSPAQPKSTTNGSLNGR